MIPSPFPCSFSSYPYRPLRKLLLDEKRPQITQLPRTSHTQHRQLHQRPPHNPAIDTLTLIPKLHLPLPLKHLLPPHILESRIQIPNLLHHILHLSLITAFNLGRVADGHVELEFDSADLGAGEEEAGGGGHVCGREAEAVVAGVGGGEGELAGGGGALGDDAVVVVEGFVDGYEDALCECV